MLSISPATRNTCRNGTIEITETLSGAKIYTAKQIQFQNENKVLGLGNSGLVFHFARDAFPYFHH